MTVKPAGRALKAKPPAPAIEINPGFRRALDIMEGTSRHVFITFLTRFQYKKAEESLPAADKRAILLEAIRDGGELEIVYLKPDDTKTRRRIRPESVEMMEYHRRTFEGVRAYCHKRGECRTFRLDRILEIN